MRHWKFPADASYAGSADREGFTVMAMLALGWAAAIWMFTS